MLRKSEYIPVIWDGTFRKIKIFKGIPQCHQQFYLHNIYHSETQTLTVHSTCENTEML